jgi:hypothetical protein
MKSHRVLLSAIACALLAVPAAWAGHPQALPGGGTVTFKDKAGGNEWWVEAIVSSSSPVSKVEVMDDGGPWATMTHRPEWGSWALSYHVEPGHRVTFRATTAAGVVTSCPFTHPAGVEQCPPQPTTWQTSVVGEVRPYGYGGDMALADVDNDGRRDVLVGRSNGMRTFEWTGSGWATEEISGRLFDTAAAGDADNDGSTEAYGMAVGSPGTDLVQYRKVGGAWQETRLLGFAQTVAGDMTLGNIDGVAGTEVYVGMVATTCDPGPNPICTSESTVYLVRKGATGWTAQAIATLSGHVDSMWIGDGDNNGRVELYVGHGTRHADRTSQVQRVNGQWVVTGLPGYGGSDSGFSLVVVGDGDRDGRNEVYQANYFGVFLKHTYSQTNGWTPEPMFGSGGLSSPEGNTVHPTSLFLGDADGDGSQELYAATDLGELYQVRWSGTAWTATRISYPDDPFGRGHGANGLVVVGDGDGDGRREAYTTFGFHMPNTGEDGVDRTYKVALAAPGFDATFTGVRGNEWWVQAMVNGNGATVGSVDVRLNGGDWKPLAKQSWGGWAASYRIVQGTIVQLRATSTAGGTDLSDCYRWIPPSNTDATKVACPTDPDPDTFDATFTNVKGNEWWAEVVVKANAPVNVVFAYIGSCSTEPADMTFRADWGKWVLGNTRIPPGTKVVFEAHGEGGSERSGGYIWPDATPTTGC